MGLVYRWWRPCRPAFLFWLEGFKLPETRAGLPLPRRTRGKRARPPRGAAFTHRWRHRGGTPGLHNRKQLNKTTAPSANNCVNPQIYCINQGIYEPTYCGRWWAFVTSSLIMPIFHDSTHVIFLNNFKSQIKSKFSRVQLLKILSLFMSPSHSF